MRGCLHDDTHLQAPSTTNLTNRTGLSLIDDNSPSAHAAATHDISPSDLVLIDCEPYGLPAALDRSTWQSLGKLRLHRLRLMRGHVYAVGDRVKITVGRFMTATEGDGATTILYRNGNPLDLRRENVVAFCRSTYLNATRTDATPIVGTRFKDGSKRPRGYVSPAAKLAEVRG